MKIEQINFEQIFPVWRNHLWPDRISPIESHSAMQWPFGGEVFLPNKTVFDYTTTFWAVIIDGNIVAANSGHRSSENFYRSRGLWVDPDYRKQGLAQLIFTVTEWQARREGCTHLWSLPRQTALSSYTAFGFEPVGEFAATETSDANIHAIKQI